MKDLFKRAWLFLNSQFGVVEYELARQCWRCGGEGIYSKHEPDFDCPDCNGTGIEKTLCPATHNQARLLKKYDAWIYVRNTGKIMKIGDQYI